MIRSTLVCIATLIFALLSSSNNLLANLVVMDSVTNNGSFETELNTGNTSVTNNGGVSPSVNFDANTANVLDGQRFAIDPVAGTNEFLTIPGWTIEVFNNFGGINYANSTPSSDGFNNLVTNHSSSVPGRVIAVSDVIGTINPGQSLNFSGDFGMKADEGVNDANRDFDYQISFLFDGVEDLSTKVAADFFRTGTGTPEFFTTISNSFAYSGSAVADVQLRVQLTTRQGQTVGDNFNVSVVPEPSAFLFGTLVGGIGLLFCCKKKLEAVRETLERSE